MILYAGQVVIGLTILALEGVALWGAVEGIYWIYCKVRGVKY